MRPFLPTRPHWLPILIALSLAALMGAAASGEDGEEAVGPVEDEGEPIKQLVFIEQHLAQTGVVDGLQSPYDVKVAPDGNHVYVASMQNDAISYFRRDLVEGSLTYAGFVAQSELGENALDGARSLALSPDGAFVYAVSMVSNSLTALARDSSTGALSFVDAIYDSEAGVDGLDGARSVVISPDGKNLYVAAYDDSKLSVFSRDNTTGLASFLGAYEKGDQGVAELTEPHALAISPDGKTLYVALWKNEVVVFGRDSSTGLLTYQSKLAYLVPENVGNSSGTVRAIAVSPDGNFVYVTSWNTDSLTVFSRDTTTGELTHLVDVKNSQESVSYMDGPHALTISSDGKYIYVAAVNSDSVTSFERDAETGLVSYFQSIRPGTGDDWSMNGPVSIGASPDGEHVYVGSGLTPHSLVTFRREIILDPPVYVVQPSSVSIEENESVAFYALAQGVDVSYQWSKGGAEIPDATLPVFTIDSASLSEDGSVFTVEISNSGGTVKSSDAVLTVLPPIVVQAPADLTALDISSNSARLVWRDRSDNETGFEIQRRITGGEFVTIANVFEDVSQYEDASLSASTTYRYRVRARRGEVLSLWSNDAVIESFDDAPQAPANLRVVEQTYNKVVIGWSDRSAVEDDFRIMRRKDEFGSQWTQVGTAYQNATQYEDRSVLPQSTYAYRVLAYNESGESDYSNSVVGITSAIPVESISPSARSVLPDAASGFSISVISSKDWEAISSVDWIVVTSPANGEGNGNEEVIYRVTANESQNERIGTVVVGGHEHTVAQGGSPPFLRVKPERTEATAPGGTVFVSIESNLEWSVSESVDWIAITSGASGNDYGTVTLSLSPNASFESRLAEIQVNDLVHEVEQVGAVPFLEVDTDDASFTSAGGSGTITISSNAAWEASVSASWIEFSSSASGEGDGSLSFIVAEHAGAESRLADIVINDKAVSISQEAPAQERDEEGENPKAPDGSPEAPPIEAPEFVSIEEGDLGALVSWVDNSSTELGFRLRRAVVGSERFVELPDLGPDVTTYFDRDAPRGKALEYRIAAFDEIGVSSEASMTSETLPGSNIISIATRAGMGADGAVAYSNFRFAGEGTLLLQREGFGLDLDQLSLGFDSAATRLRMDSAVGAPYVLGSGTSFDWAVYYQFANSLGSDAFQEGAVGLGYVVSTEEGSDAFTRGASVLGALSTESSVIAAGFEIAGEIELPVLLQGLGPSLARLGLSDLVANPRIELYALLDSGAATLIAANDSWKDAENQTLVSYEQAVAKTGASGLDAQGAEAGLLLMLGEGRYIAVLRGGDAAYGSAMLEVLDAR